MVITCNDPASCMYRLGFVFEMFHKGINHFDSWFLYGTYWPHVLVLRPKARPGEFFFPKYDVTAVHLYNILLICGNY